VSVRFDHRPEAGCFSVTEYLSIVANRQLAENTILVFRASDDLNRTVLLMLSGATASARSEEKKEPRPPPLTGSSSRISKTGTSRRI